MIDHSPSSRVADAPCLAVLRPAPRLRSGSAAQLTDMVNALGGQATRRRHDVRSGRPSVLARPWRRRVGAGVPGVRLGAARVRPHITPVQAIEEKSRLVIHGAAKKLSGLSGPSLKVRPSLRINRDA